MLDFSSMPRFEKQKFQIFNLVEEWASAYGVDSAAILRQIPIAHAWCNANPKRAPKHDVARFLYNWMGIAKRKGTLVVKEPDRRYKETLPEPDMTAEDLREIRRQNFPQYRPDPVKFKDSLTTTLAEAP